jgi:SAM-dependent MidA family methyltransferase
MTRSAPPSILPPLTPAEAEHSARVEALIRRRIGEAGGWIDFETYMDLALYAPGLGYYSAGSAKIGRAGDFVTAPELSDLFSRCVARQCAQALGKLAHGGGELLELGAGTGRMAAAMLQELATLDALPARYAILEVSADLRSRQQERLAGLPASLREKVIWLERLPAQPIEGVILANEVLDALACRRFMIRGAAGVGELGVAIGESGALVEAMRPACARVAEAVAALVTELPRPLPDGYRSELCLRVAPWVLALADSLARGLVLLFDYGLPRGQYYHPERRDGTLRCHFRQRAHDAALIHPGVQDITAWVDFTRVAEAADAARLDVLGFATQAAFLLGTGIESMLAEAADLTERTRLAGEARRLLMPGEMGEAFKVMALGRGYDRPLCGFAHQDLRASL